MGECCSDGVATAVMVTVASMVLVVVSAGMVAAPAPPRSLDSRLASESILLSRYPGQEEFKSEYSFLRQLFNLLFALASRIKGNWSFRRHKV